MGVPIESQLKWNQCILAYEIILEPSLNSLSFTNWIASVKKKTHPLSIQEQKLTSEYLDGLWKAHELFAKQCGWLGDLEKHLLCDLSFHNGFEGESALALFGHKLWYVLVTNGEIVEFLPSSAALLFNPLTSNCHFQIGIDPVLARHRVQACSSWHQFKTMFFALFCFFLVLRIALGSSHVLQIITF